jgi:hypothetical protein
MSSEVTPKYLLVLSDAYRKRAEQPIPRSLRGNLRKQYGVPLPAGATFADAIALALHIKGMSGDVPACRELREGVEGRAPQKVNAPIQRVARLVFVESYSPILNPEALLRNREFPKPGE